jgi:hypothetical protein
VLENSTSVLLTRDSPATFPNMDSTPRKDAVLAIPQPAERAQGLISSWVAPAEPARSGFPAIRVAPAISGSAIKSAIDLFIVGIFCKLLYWSNPA